MAKARSKLSASFKAKVDLQAAKGEETAAIEEATEIPWSMPTRMAEQVG